MVVETPTITIDLLLFSFTVGLAGLMSLLWLVWLGIRLRNDTEFRFRVQRKSWVWVFMKQKAGPIRRIAIESSKIGADQGVDVGKGRYFLHEKDDEGKSTVHQHRNKLAWIFTQDNPNPHAFVPHSLDAKFHPETMQHINEGNITKRLAEMRAPNTSMIIQTIILVFIVIGIGATIYLLVKQTDAITALQHLLSPPASTPPTPPGVPG